MSNEPTTTDRQPLPDASGPAFAPPAYGAPSSEPTYQPTPAPAYQPTPEPTGPQDHQWTPEGLTSTPALPPERVGRGAALALLAIPAGAAVAGIIGALGFIATLSGLATAVLAAVLYVRGSGGRVKKGIPVIIGVIVLGIAASFFTVVAVELWQAYATVDPEIAAAYPSRSSFVMANLFYPPVLAEGAKDLAMLVVFGALGAVATIVRLVKASHSH